MTPLPDDFNWAAFDRAMDGEGYCPRCDEPREDGACPVPSCGWEPYDPAETC